MFGRRYLEVNSFHHQGLHSLGKGLAIAGHAPDGQIEAIEARGRRFTFGVQWHAECLVERPEQLALFRGLVRAAHGHEVAPRMVAVGTLRCASVCGPRWPTSSRHTLIKTASYEAEPGEVGRVLLLYSGGLDTSVMLKWIQDEYEAEVVALTVNLGQPGEDYDVIRGKALQLGALDCHVVDAREEFARDYVAAGDQGQRALRRRLPAVHRARPPADREAGGRVRARDAAATRSPTAAPARATTRCGSSRR